MRRPRNCDRNDLAIDRANRPALRTPSTRRHLRSINRPSLHPAPRRANKRRLPHRATRRRGSSEHLDLHRVRAAHAQREPPEGCSRTVAASDRAWPRDPHIPRPPTRSRARTRMVRGLPFRTLRRAALAALVEADYVECNFVYEDMAAGTEIVGSHFKRASDCCAGPEESCGLASIPNERNRLGGLAGFGAYAHKDLPAGEQMARNVD